MEAASLSLTAYVQKNRFTFKGVNHSEKGKRKRRFATACSATYSNLQIRKMKHVYTRTGTENIHLKVEKANTKINYTGKLDFDVCL